MRRNSNGICLRGTWWERIRGVLVNEMILSKTKRTITDKFDRITDLPLPPEVRASPQTTTTKSVAQAPLQKAPEDREGSRVGLLQAATHPDTRRPGEASLPARKFKLRPRPPRRDLSGPDSRASARPAPSGSHRRALGRRRATFVSLGRTTAIPERSPRETHLRPYGDPGTLPRSSAEQHVS